jgi:hypothetical protein
MNTIGSRARAYLVTVCLFTACVASMAVMASAGPPPASAEKPETVERLREPRVIQGVPCAGYARFDADQRLTSCTLSEEHAFGSLVLPANTQIRRFHPDGSPKDVHLGREARFDGHLLRGEGPGGWMAGFTPEGRLEYGFLVERETIDGVPCERGTFWGEITGGVIVRFHPDGRLKTCRLSADTLVGGRTCRKGERIWLDPQGAPEAGPGAGAR